MNMLHVLQVFIENLLWGEYNDTGDYPYAGHARN